MRRLLDSLTAGILNLLRMIALNAERVLGPPAAAVACLFGGLDMILGYIDFDQPETASSALMVCGVMSFGLVLVNILYGIFIAHAVRHLHELFSTDRSKQRLPDNPY